ncbi:hypothetical protein R3P38DRAFT_2881818 [Favolaschia claudopus]|uniref:Uncharacterized protein n=1 Tax=Favolaschia claudopus TaxID=2862362 RepID=A0AAW0D0R2_9AGAR
MSFVKSPTVEQCLSLLQRFPNLENVDDAAQALSIIITMFSLEPGIPMNPRYEYINHGLELLKNKRDLHDKLKIAHAEKSYNDLRTSVLLQRPDCILPKAARDLLDELEAPMASFLKEDPPIEHWASQPPSLDRDIEAHINSLQLLGKGLPLVILKDLGCFVHNPVLSSRVQNLFTRGKKTVIVNTSGSGKTRLTFEGLCHNWGFYFAHRNLFAGDGSTDLAVTAEHISALLDPGTSLDKHHAAAERHLSQLLLARLLFFRMFLKLCVEGGLTLTDEHKKQWLLLQVYPGLGSTADIFKTLTVFLSEYDSNLLIPDTVARIRELLGSDSHLFLVLDEAQTAANTFPDPKEFDLNYGTYPYLRKIVDTWDQHFSPDSISWVIAGTRVPKRIFEAPQYRYMRQFLPPSLLHTDSGKAFLQRAWAWTRGRHRYTASLLTELLVWNFQQPHTVLDTYIEKVTHFRPTDGKQWTEAESRENVIIPKNLDSLRLSTNDFSSLDHLDVRESLREVIYHYIAADRPWPVFGRDMIGASANLGRFIDRDLEQVVFNEPIALVGGASFLTELPSDSLLRRYTFVDNCLVAFQRTPPPSAKAFAAYLAFYFHRALAVKPKLSDVFTFTNPVPAWAKQSVELLKPLRTLDYCPLATSTTSLEEVMTWLARSTSDRTPFCIPAAAASSPDLLFVLKLKNGVCITVAMRLSVGDSDGGELLADLEDEKMFCGSENDAEFKSHQRAIELLNSFEDDDVEGTPKKKVDKGKKKEGTTPRVLCVVAAFNKQIDLGSPLEGGLSSAQAALSLEMFNEVIANLAPKTFVGSVASNVLKRKRDDLEIDSDEGGKEDREGRGRERKRHHTAPPERGDDTDAEMTSPGHKYHTRSQDRPGKKGSPVQRSLQEGRYKGRLLAAK